MASTSTDANTDKMNEIEKAQTNLLDLPPEISQAIIHELVAIVRPGKPLKMRLTCRAFARDILHEYCFYFPWTYDKLRRYEGFAEHNMSSILYNKTKHLAGAHPDLPNKIIAMADWISHEQGWITNKERDYCVQLLCNMIARTHSSSETTAMLYGDRNRKDFAYYVWTSEWFDAAQAPLNASDKLAAAAMMGNASLVKPLMSDFRRMDRHQVFGDGLHIAATTENLNFAQAVSDCLDSLKGEDSPNYEHLISHMIHGGQNIGEQEGAWDDAAVAAMQHCKSTAMIKLLVDMCSKHSLLVFKK
ncbi:hypothetical protein SLS60_007006 [Paraconiothyrium brasiliense]|uniref:F-box domain-containing protein n=1 Tax=Paraconiothyrium brasiliense TaxID=300254 RepID=A0ABR3R866_9PLEO